MSPLAGLVTGGASGIGEACVRAFVAEGHQVVIADYSLERAENLARELGPAAVGVQADVSKEGDCRKMVDVALVEFGRLDFAVNNAGTGNVDKSPVADISVDEWHRLMSVNLDGVFLSLKAEIPALIKAGGSIVNVASIMGSVATAGAGAYVASKHGVVGLTKAAALDYADQGIRVNAIGPGYIETPMLANRSEEQRAEIGSRHPLGRLGTPGEIAQLALFLISPASSFVTGSFYLADGGYTAR
ncbi:SDR family oxidoreductase [Cryobacterium sp. TMS1-20-1]|uniref:SDR family NAD(P)-dependent oxidoreductase n=1 Tax=Cryobacterium sp. TMS1-20-1 TaxID=1259223 RepID=UPI00106DA3AF|nr:SDR family oxidoreductase [Cryobacterium sp. TMS1-20-1]TFC80541.1 SDR family oxidoreductase [Cryobacterium sp. TMS1-20-1]